jgi:hypothetical protein
MDNIITSSVRCPAEVDKETAAVEEAARQSSSSVLMSSDDHVLLHLKVVSVKLRTYFGPASLW